MNRRRILRKAIIIVFAVFVGWIGLSSILYLMAGRIIYLPEFGEGATYSIPYRIEFVLNGEGERIEMMWIPEGQDWQKETTYLYLHGNVGRLPYIVEGLSKKGNVLSPSYPGFSGSEGKSNTEKIYEVVDLSMNFLHEKGIEDGDIVILGHSLGGSPAVYAAVEYPNLSEVILVNTFYNLKEMCKVNHSIFCIFADGFHNSAAIAPQAKAKIRQFHDVDDEIIPRVQGEALFKLLGSKDKKLFDLSGKHADFSIDEVLERRTDNQ